MALWLGSRWSTLPLSCMWAKVSAFFSLFFFCLSLSMTFKVICYVKPDQRASVKELLLNLKPLYLKKYLDFIFIYFEMQINSPQCYWSLSLTAGTGMPLSVLHSSPAQSAVEDRSKLSASCRAVVNSFDLNGAQSEI